jgi:predicted GNAT family N-acyltransferase
MDNVFFQIIDHGSDDYSLAVKLREDVLRKSIGMRFSKEELEEEKKHIQIVGKLNDEIVSTAVLAPEKDKVKMQRVAVSEKVRNQNIGSEMTKFCEGIALNLKAKEMYVHARDKAVNFYKKNNYVAEGEFFEEDNTPHLKMIKSLV